MILQIPHVLSPQQTAFFLEKLSNENVWGDGRMTAGHQGAKVKHNQQIPQDDPLSSELGNIILEALEQNALFLSAALPLKVMPPFFNRYKDGGSFGTHIDGAIRRIYDPFGGSVPVRTDLSATLFLSHPDDYDGGELVIEDTLGTHQVKLDAGSLILYPSSSLHYVTPVTKGQRVAAFFWLQSMVRSNEHRGMLYDLDQSIQHLTGTIPDDPALIRLTGLYHNLLRQWAEL